MCERSKRPEGGDESERGPAFRLQDARDLVVHAVVAAYLQIKLAKSRSWRSRGACLVRKETLSTRFGSTLIDERYVTFGRSMRGSARRIQNPLKGELSSWGCREGCSPRSSSRWQSSGWTLSTKRGCSPESGQRPTSLRTAFAHQRNTFNVFVASSTRTGAVPDRCRNAGLMHVHANVLSVIHVLCALSFGPEPTLKAYSERAPLL
jgi:hypothetical protein